MEMFKTLVRDDAALVGWGVSVLLATGADQSGRTAACLSDMGVRVKINSQLYDALSALLDDPYEADMLMIDCDSFGGVEVGKRALAILTEARLRLPVVLVASDCPEQKISEGRDQPSILRAPVTAVAMRVAFEAAFRGRMRSLIP